MNIVQAYWKKQHSGADFDTFWRKSLHDGWVEGTAFAPKQVAKQELRGFPAAPSPDAKAIEINFRRDPSIYDGQFSNNGWLQELPKPMNKLTWDNPVLMGPAMADRMGIKTEDLVELELNGKKVTAPVWIQVGHPDNSITVFLGYGRRRAGRVGTGAGFDMYALRTSATPWFASGVAIRKAGGTYKLASTQGYQTMDTPTGARPLVRTASIEEYRKEPDFAREEEPPKELTLYKPYPYAAEPYAWGMTVDMNACVGCNNCIIACQSENNIAVVGKEQTVLGRHMHWLRVDAYYQGDRDNPKAYFQPVPCQQCENAPCEVVCPVGATVHSSEGLNDMVYNRCVGTRYCSNNCPYKVRRFNFLLFQDWETPQLQDDAQSGCDRAQPRRDGKVHLLRAAHQPAPDRRRTRRPQDPGWRIADRLPAVVPGRRHRFRQHQRSQQPSFKTEGAGAELQSAGGPEHASPHHVPGRHSQSEPGTGSESTSVANTWTRPVENQRAPVIEPGHTFGSVTDKISSIVLTRPTSNAWFVGFGVMFLLTMMLLFAIAYLFVKGVGIWGVTIPIGWGFAIVNFVWWIGIGHAGTLISAILLLLRQSWRNSINRFAEAMTLFAVASAGHFPADPRRTSLACLLALSLSQHHERAGRSSAARWCGTFSRFPLTPPSRLLFWFIGLIPDLATLRDRSEERWKKIIYGMLAMGWRGSARHWHRYETAYLLLAGLATPLVLSVHTVVSFDFAVGIVPGWHTTIFPPYFVAGAIYSGFAMVLMLAIPIRKFYGLEDFITERHLQNSAKVMLATGIDRRLWLRRGSVHGLVWRQPL